VHWVRTQEMRRGRRLGVEAKWHAPVAEFESALCLIAVMGLGEDGRVQSRFVSEHWGPRSLMQVCQQEGRLWMDWADAVETKIIQPMTALEEVRRCMVDRVADG